jgi:hypothetical protein
MRRVLRILCAVVALLSLDSMIGAWSAGPARPELSLTRPESGVPLGLLVVFPGYRMPGTLLSQAFGPHLGPGDGMIVEGRAGGWHLPLIERPQETMAAIITAHRPGAVDPLPGSDPVTPSAARRGRPEVGPAWSWL